MKTNLLKASALGIAGLAIGIMLICILSLVFPWNIAGWIDGIPFGAIALIARSLAGGVIGIIAGIVLGWRNDRAGPGAFIGALAGGAIGIVLFWGDINIFDVFFWGHFTAIAVFVMGIVLSLYFRPRHPAKYALSTAAFCLFLILQIAGRFLSFQPDALQLVVAISNLVAIIAWILILIALSLQAPDPNRPLEPEKGQ